MLYDDVEDQGLSVEAQVALLMGDDDAEELCNEVPRWQIGGTRARTFEREKLTFDPVSQPNTEWSN